MNAADRLRELLATRPAIPNVEELTRWWRTSAELLPQVLDELAGLQIEVDAYNDASTPASDEIAKLCGCPTWEYPGQVIRDVQGVVAERDKLCADLAEAMRYVDDAIRAAGTERVSGQPLADTFREMRADLDDARAALRREQDARAELRVELDRERAQHKANVEGLESALAQEAHEKSTLEQVEARLRAEVDVLRQEVRELEQQRDAATARLREATNLDDRDAEIMALRCALRSALATWCPRDPGGDGADGDAYRLAQDALDGKDRRSDSSVTVVGRTAVGLVTLQVTDPATIALLKKKGATPVGLGYLLGVPAVPAAPGDRACPPGFLCTHDVQCPGTVR